MEGSIMIQNRFQIDAPRSIPDLMALSSFIWLAKNAIINLIIWKITFRKNLREKMWYDSPLKFLQGNQMMKHKCLSKRLVDPLCRMAEYACHNYLNTKLRTHPVYKNYDIGYRWWYGVKCCLCSSVKKDVLHWRRFKSNLVVDFLSRLTSPAA